MVPWVIFQRSLVSRGLRLQEIYRVRALALIHFVWMHTLPSFYPPPVSLCHSSNVNFVLVLRNLIQHHRAIYQTFIIQAHFFWGGRAGVRSLSKSCSWPHAKLRLLSPKPCRTKASAYLKRWFQGEGGAFWILPLSWRCNQDCKSSSLNVKRCRVVSHTALLWFPRHSVWSK